MQYIEILVLKFRPYLRKRSEGAHQCDGRTTLNKQPNKAKQHKANKKHCISIMFYFRLLQCPPPKLLVLFGKLPSPSCSENIANECRQLKSQLLILKFLQCLFSIVLLLLLPIGVAQSNNIQEHYYNNIKLCSSCLYVNFSYNKISKLPCLK